MMANRVNSVAITMSTESGIVAGKVDEFVTYTTGA